MISAHEYRLYRTLRMAGDRWTTARHLARTADIAERTARHHLVAFVDMGLVDWVELAAAAGGYRYRLATNPTGVAAARRDALDQLGDVLGAE